MVTTRIGGMREVINSVYTPGMANTRNKPSPGSDQPMPAPEEFASHIPEDVRARARALRRWLEKNGVRPAQLARMSKLSEMSISKYLRGESSILKMTPGSITKLLTGMHVSDSYAWELFDIPASERARWRSLRTDAMGPPGQADGYLTYVLDAPASGEWALPRGTLITVDPSDKEAATGLLVAVLGGRYVIGVREMLPEKAEVLGRLTGAAPASA